MNPFVKHLLIVSPRNAALVAIDVTHGAHGQEC
jgi:hypothetical protein